MAAHSDSVLDEDRGREKERRNGEWGGQAKQRE